MKKLFLTMCVALLSMGAQAQEKGDFAVGVKGGLAIAKIEFGSEKETLSRAAFGAFAQYNLSNHWRVELEGLYHPKKDHFSDLTMGLNIHYLFNVAENFYIYPQLGYGLAFTKTEEYTTYYAGGSSITVGSDNTTDGGIQLGLGAQYNLNDQWFVLADYKFQPGIFGDGHVVNVGVGVRF